CDDVGNLLALTDSGGAVVERYEYDDYGQPQFLAADGSPLVDGGGLPVTSSPQGNPFLFRGMFWDAESGLYAATGGRYLDPQTGRYCDKSANAASCRVSSAATFAGDNPWGGPDCNVVRGCWIGLDKSSEAGTIGGRSSVGNGSSGVFLSRGSVSRTILKSFFEHGDRPTAAQFSSLIDSSVNKITDRYLIGLRASAKAGGLNSSPTTGNLELIIK
ncbi:MAG: repeat protein, partial [Pedosphaera sp.]|nr:repeat protein [Pedosphaera sp.]